MDDVTDHILVMPVGIEIVRKALRIPCHTIAANAGVDAQEVVTRVTQEQQDVGYDALHDTYVDMMKTGIIDPTKVSFHRLYISNSFTGVIMNKMCLSWLKTIVENKHLNQ